MFGQGVFSVLVYTQLNNYIGLCDCDALIFVDHIALIIGCSHIFLF